MAQAVSDGRVAAVFGHDARHRVDASYCQGDRAPGNKQQRSTIRNSNRTRHSRTSAQADARSVSSIPRCWSSKHGASVFREGNAPALCHCNLSKHAINEFSKLVHTICSVDTTGYECEMIFALHEKGGPGFTSWEGGSCFNHAKKLGLGGMIVQDNNISHYSRSRFQSRSPALPSACTRAHTKTYKKY